MKVIVKAGENIVDIALKGKGMESLVDFLVDNELYLGSELIAGQEVTVVAADTVPDVEPFVPREYGASAYTQEKNIRVLPDQDVVDLALQYSGHVEGLIDLLSANGMALNDDVTGALLVRSRVADRTVVAYYEKTNYVVASTTRGSSLAANAIVTEEGFAIVTEDGTSIVIE
jgi:hypothetical protein